MYLRDKDYTAPVETPTEPWRKVLLDAADYIREHGWCQYILERGDGRVCVVGAIGHVVPETPKSAYAYADAITEPMLKHLGWKSSIDHWNDTRRTKEEVISALENAARQSFPEVE